MAGKEEESGRGRWWCV